MNGMRLFRRELAAAAVVALTAGTVAACSSSPPAITAKGTVTVDYTSTAMGGPGDDLSDGDQVVVVNSSGTVVGTGTLTLQNFTQETDGSVGDEDVFNFTVTVPGGLPRYGIQVNGTSHGTLWDSAAQMKAGPAVEIDETGS